MNRDSSQFFGHFFEFQKFLKCRFTACIRLVILLDSKLHSDNQLLRSFVLLFICHLCLATLVLPLHRCNGWIHASIILHRFSSFGCRLFLGFLTSFALCSSLFRIVTRTLSCQLGFHSLDFLLKLPLRHLLDLGMRTVIVLCILVLERWRVLASSRLLLQLVQVVLFIVV